MRICVTYVLARPTCGPKVSLGDIRCLECLDIVMKWNLWPVALQDALTTWVYFTMKCGFHSGALESKIKTAYSRKKRGKSHIPMALLFRLNLHLTIVRARAATNTATWMMSSIIARFPSCLIPSVAHERTSRASARSGTSPLCILGRSGPPLDHLTALQR